MPDTRGIPGTMYQSFWLVVLYLHWLRRNLWVSPSVLFQPQARPVMSETEGLLPHTQNPLPDPTQNLSVPLSSPVSQEIRQSGAALQPARYIPTILSRH